MLLFGLLSFFATMLFSPRRQRNNIGTAPLYSSSIKHQHHQQHTTTTTTASSRRLLSFLRLAHFPPPSRGRGSQTTSHASSNPAQRPPAAKGFSTVE